MQRILSVERSRNSDNEGSEFISKRLCFSLLFSMAFLFLLAGYLLGRYTTDRALLLKRAYLQQKLLMEEKNPIEVIRNISNSVRSINNVTTNFPLIFDRREIYEQLNCTEEDNFRPNIDGDFAVEISKILNARLEILGRCFESIENYLRNISHHD